MKRKTKANTTTTPAGFPFDVDNTNAAEQAHQDAKLQQTIAAEETVLPPELEDQAAADERERQTREAAEAEVIPQKSIYVRGPFQDENEITWDVFPGIAPTQPRGRIYTCHTPHKALALAGIMAKDRGLQLIDARS